MTAAEKQHELFETMPVLSAVRRLVVPTIVGQIILVVYNMADTFYIGRTNDAAKITAVGVCMPAFMFLSAISNLFGVGGSSVISRCLGQGDKTRARLTAAFSVWGCAVLTAVYCLLAWVLRVPFLRFLGGSDPDVHVLAQDYLLITVTLGGFAAVYSTLFSHLLRSEGKSLSASIGIAMGGLLNIALDPLFMFVLLPKGQEVIGAAVATALSNVISLCYFWLTLRKNREDSVLRFRPSRDMLSRRVPREVLGTGLPACLMTLCENVSYAILDQLMAANDLAAGGRSVLQAGIVVAKKVNMLAHCMVRGMSQGVLPLIAYSYASGNHRRMRSSVLISMGISVALSLVFLAAARLLSVQLVGVFLPGGGDSLTYGAQFLEILCIGGPFSACAYAVISFFQATGKSLRSLLLALLRKGMLDIPLMFLLDRLMPVYGVVWATPIADICCCVAALCLFVRFLSTDRDRRTAPSLKEDFSDRSQANIPADHLRNG